LKRYFAGLSVSLLAASALVAQPIQPLPSAPVIVAPTEAPAVPTVASAEPAAGTQLTLPRSSTIFVTLDDDLSTVDSKLGDKFNVTVAANVMVGDVVAIPAGTKGVGDVTFFTKPGGFGKPGILGITLRHLQMGDRELPLLGHYREEGGNNNGGAAVAAYAVGIFAIAVRGKRSVIPAGRQLKSRNADDFSFLPQPKAAEVAATAAADQPVAAASVATAPVAENNPE
jgi:hypothetical protein